MENNQFNNMVEALTHLQGKGYTANFQVKNGQAICLETKQAYAAAEMLIHQFHRFEGESTVDDMSIVYAIACQDGTKGTIIDSYGPYSDATITKFVSSIPILSSQSLNKPELISFDLCPFVQRSVITLLEKNIEFDITYIDLKDKPEWFINLSPLGKVPVLKIGSNVLFESAVINEYLDEIYPPALHPKDPLTKAKHRAWIEFASELLTQFYKWTSAKTAEEADARLQKLNDRLNRLEACITCPFFQGEDFALIDTAYAPLLMQIDWAKVRLNPDLLSNKPKLKAYTQILLKRPSVANSVREGVREKFLTTLNEHPAHK